MPIPCVQLTEKGIRVPYGVQSHLWPILRRFKRILMEWDAARKVWTLKAPYVKAIQDVLADETEVGMSYGDRYWKTVYDTDDREEKARMLQSFRHFDHEWWIAETPATLRDDNGWAAAASNDLLAPIVVGDTLVLPRAI
jgi:hypothetical protein